MPFILLRRNLKETISKWVEDVLTSVDKWTQSLPKELSSDIQEKKEALQKKLNSEVQGALLDIQAMKMLIEATGREFGT